MKRTTVEELTKNGKYNRYTLVIATSKRAREITTEIEERAENIDTSLLNKDEINELNALRDEKPLKTAIQMFKDEKFDIVEGSLDLNATH